MGYLDAFPTATPPAISSLAAASGPEGYAPPSRTTRDRCWAARDSFFACLDANGIVDSIKDPAGVGAARQHCANQDAALASECAASWVKYFKERRIMEHKKNAMIKNLESEGATPIGGTMPPNIAAGTGAGSR